MRKGLFGYPLRWLCLGALLVAAVVGCEGGGDDPAERAEVDSADPAPGASPADSAAILRSGSKLDRQQAAQLLGDRTPAAVGESCPVLGQSCAARAFAVTTACAGFSGTCDSTGTQNGVWVDFLCLNINGSATCTAVAEQTAVTVSCSRVTNGTSCGTASCGAAFCLGYSSDCAESTTQVHNCTSAGVCSNDVCTGQTTTQTAVGSCQRNTDGIGCSRSCQITQVAVCSAGGCTCTCPSSPASICLPG